MPTFNEELLAAMVRHQIGILRYSGGVRNRIWALLDESEADLRRQITARSDKAGTEGVRRLAALAALLEGLRERRLESWRQVRREWFREMREFAKAEPIFLDSVIQTILPVEIGTEIPSATDLRNIVSSTPFEGRVFREWVDDVQRSDLRRIEDQIKIGLVQGETGPELARRVVGRASLRGRDGVTNITRRHAASITRTAVAAIGAEGRRRYAEANADLIPSEVFVATLDGKTTPICRSLDGNLYDVGEGPTLPLHWGERSLYAPAFDGEFVGTRPRRDFTERQLLREFAEREGIKAPRRRKDLPRGTKGAYDAFARQRMRELTGEAPAKLNYADFLAQQTAAVQDDILGRTRGQLFRRGGLTLDRFVEMSGRELTLSELAERHSTAFLRAGLDPERFRP